MPHQLAPSIRSQLPVGASALTGDPKVSASSLLKMEEFLGKDALDDSSKNTLRLLKPKLVLDDHNLFDDDILPGLYMELGQRLPSQRRYQQYPVYAPKSKCYSGVCVYFCVLRLSGVQRRPKFTAQSASCSGQLSCKRC